MKSALIGPLQFILPGILAFLLGTLMKLRVFPSLRPEQILSGGHLVSTEQFAQFGARCFYIGGSVFIVVGVILLIIRLGDGQPKI